MKMTLRSRLDHSSSSDLKRKRNQETTILRQGKRKSSPSSDDPPNCSRMASTRSGSRTPSGKGKGPKPYHKAIWDWENTRIYLELVVKEIDAGNRPHMSINLNGYRSLAKTFEAATGLTHSMKQLKNKYNQLKAEWRAWSKLMDSRKGPTGIGFDQETGLINASDEWWATMEKVDKECCKFRTKRLEHEELMRRVFTGAAATGKNAWTPGEMRNQLEVEGESIVQTSLRTATNWVPLKLQT
ncbi:L10-interacting MYB domain-containing protein-like [Camellia sinensis]|uniref:L10-interacting MYB domain-containing protein-like n=1 Tax=Camellia sinensis TaxID=4442 RepID=UPI001036EF75|nr:L10-interacting MYB domain-containing protein-like [Camellia sinensis]